MSEDAAATRLVAHETVCAECRKQATDRSVGSSEW